MSARERQAKTAGTDYGAGINSTKGNLTVGGQSYTNLNYDDTLKAYQNMNAWRDA